MTLNMKTMKTATKPRRWLEPEAEGNMPDLLVDRTAEAHQRTSGLSRPLCFAAPSSPRSAGPPGAGTPPVGPEQPPGWVHARCRGGVAGVPRPEYAPQRSAKLRRPRLFRRAG